MIRNCVIVCLSSFGLPAILAGCQKPDSQPSVARTSDVESPKQATKETLPRKRADDQTETRQVQIQFSGRDIAKPGQVFRKGERVELSGQLKWTDRFFMVPNLRVLVVSFSAANSVPVGIPIVSGSSPPTDGKPYALVKNSTDQFASLHGEIALPPTAGQCQVLASIATVKRDPSGTKSESAIEPIFQTSVELGDE
jgi:hypothetical protein